MTASERPPRLRTPGRIDPENEHFKDHKTIADLINEYDRRLYNLETVILFVFVWLAVLTFTLSVAFGLWVVL